uniref:Uncharacterized protein n=1 Tax=Amphimedon queenslandica TaxID=400682 RepID=A0A1X7UT76_AMPQE
MRTARRKCRSNPTPERIKSVSLLESNLGDEITKAEAHYVSSLINQSVVDKSKARIFSHIRSLPSYMYITPFIHALSYLFIYLFIFYFYFFFHFFSFFFFFFLVPGEFTRLPSAL